MIPLPRWMHRFYAFVYGYFWLPCPSCGASFGGHEAQGVLWTEPGFGKACCGRCDPWSQKADS